MKHGFIVLALIAVFGLLTTPALAGARADGASKHVQTLGDRAIGIISDKNLNEEQKHRRFHDLFDGYFDSKTIARFVLGKHWRNASSEQQKEYLKLFENMVVNVYSKRFEDYTDEKFEVAKAIEKGKRDSIVTSYIYFSGDRPALKLDWRVRQKKSGAFKVIDLAVEGVSMSVTQRSDFDSVIQRGGGDVEVLLADLRKR